MIPRSILPLALLLAGCSNPPEPTEVSFPPDATGLSANAFIAEATAHEFDRAEFYREFGLPEVQERDGELVLLYDCRDKSVSLSVVREKFDRGVIDVVEGEAY